MPYTPASVLSDEAIESRQHNSFPDCEDRGDGTRLWLVDWKYAGYNTAIFDLANLASNNLMSAKQREEIMGLALDRAITAEDRIRLEALMCASLLRETMWSMVQETHSALDVDYIAYTGEYLDRFERTIADWRAAN